MGRYLRMYWLPGSKSTASRSAPSSLGGIWAHKNKVRVISQSDSTSVTRLIPRPSLPPVFNHLQKPNLLFLYTVSVINKRMGRLGTVTQLNIEDCQSAVVTQIFKMEVHVGSLAKG